MTREKQMRRDLDARIKDKEGELFFEELGDALKQDRDLRHRISIRRLLEEFVPSGREIVDSWNPEFGGAGAHAIPAQSNLRESGSAVSSSAFSHITGQIVFSELMERFDDEAFVFSDIVPNVPTKLNGQLIPGYGRMGNVAEVIGEGKPYPRAGLSEDWIRSPQTRKRGLMLDLTREAVFFDVAGNLLEEAGEVGYWLGLNKELRIIDAFVDENATDHRYNWRDTVYASYQTSSPWDNVTASAGLVDWTDVDEAEQTLSGITDPNTGTRIINTPKDLVVTRQNLYAAKRITTATEIEVTTPGYATSANPTGTKTRNPISGYRIVSSLLLADRMATDTTWYLGDIARMIRYMENFPLQVEQAPPSTGDMWERDIAMSWKAGERGAAFVKEPRLTTKCTA
jgi:hypothetical protein